MKEKNREFAFLLTRDGEENTAKLKDIRDATMHHVSLKTIMTKRNIERILEEFAFNTRREFQFEETIEEASKHVIAQLERQKEIGSILDWNIDQESMNGRNVSVRVTIPHTLERIGISVVLDI